VAGNAGGGHGASMGSWLACLVIIIGFGVGGAAMIVWNWPLFWVGVGLVVLGCVIARAVHIMDDVTEYGGGGAGGDPEPSSG
jgi:fatty acid desaturase